MVSCSLYALRRNEVVRVHVPELRRCRVDIGHDRERHVVEPDIFAHCIAAGVRLGEELALLVVEVARGKTWSVWLSPISRCRDEE